MAVYAPQADPVTGGTLAPVTKKPKKPTPSKAANTNQGSGTAKDKHPPGKPFKWKNGTWHTRRQGEKYRSDSSSTGGAGSPTTPTRPSKHPYLDQANAQADIRYGDVESSLNQRGLAIPQWYSNYMSDAASAITQQQQLANPLLQQAQARADEAGQVAKGVDPNSEAGQDAALAAAARKAMGEQFVNALGGINNAQQNYLVGRQGVAATSELGAQQQLATDRTNEKKERGAFVTDTRAKLKDAAWQKKLEAATFGIKQAESSNQLNKFGYTDSEWNSFSDAKRNRIRNKDSSSSSSGPDLGAVNKYGYTEKKWRNMSTAKRKKIINDWETEHNDPQAKPGEKAKNPFTYAARQKTKGTIRSDVELVKSQIGKKGYTSGGFWNKAYHALVSEKGRDPLLARATIQVMRHGHVSPAIAKKLKAAYGIEKPPTGKKIKLPIAAGDVPVVGGIIQIGQNNQP